MSTVPLHKKGNTVVTVDGEIFRRSHNPQRAKLDGTDDIVVTLYKTDVVSLEGYELTLDTGGYPTATTAQRMNQFFSQYLGGGLHVSGKKGKLHVVPSGFTVGIEIERTLTLDVRDFIKE